MVVIWHGKYEMSGCTIWQRKVQSVVKVVVREIHISSIHVHYGSRNWQICGRKSFCYKLLPITPLCTKNYSKAGLQVTNPSIFCAVYFHELHIDL